MLQWYDAGQFCIWLRGSVPDQKGWSFRSCPVGQRLCHHQLVSIDVGRSLSPDGLGYGFVSGSASSFAYVACRGLLYLTASFWMQKLIASRLDLLEKSSNRNYSSGYIRSLLRAQGCGALVTAASLCGTAICFMLCGQGGHACYHHFGYGIFFFLLGPHVTGNLGCMC